LIAKNVLGSDTSSVTFSSIPATHDDLWLVCSTRSTTVATQRFLGMRFNGDSSDVYLYRRLYGTGSAAGSDTDTLTELLTGYIPAASNTADTFGSLEAYIPNYAGSANKSVSASAVTENNGSTAHISAVAGLWPDTDAITSIYLFPETGNFKSGSSFYLYGITKA
jgi:hypothetical protein